MSSIPPLPVNETERLEALRRYSILDTPPEIGFDRITSLAARLFDVPIVLVSLLDESRAWFKSCYGFNQQEIPRDASICSFALLSDEVLVIPDAREDDRFACNSYVQGEPGLRFYASAPLLTEDGFNLGLFCLVDTKPRAALTNEQQAILTDLAAMVVDELELRLAARKIAQVDAALLEVTQGISAVTGKAFFNALVQHLTKALDVNYACISLLLEENPERVKTIAFCAEGEIIENVEYELQDTPCLEVIRQQKLGCYPNNLQALFPKDLFLVSLGIESYSSIPFFDSRGKLLGLLGVMDNKPIENVQLIESLLTLLAMRIAAELERQQAEEMQQAAAQRLQLYADVVRSTQVGIVVWQLEDPTDPGSFRLMIANPAASETTGFDFEPMIGMTMAASFPTLLQSPLAQQYLEVVHTGRSLDLGEVSYGEDGITAGIYSLKAFPLPDNCLGLAFENITARKQIEAQLQESQHYNQQIAEAIPGVVFVHDIIEQRNVYTNRQITDLLGYTSEQVQAMGANAIATLVHPDDLQRVLAYSEAFHAVSGDAVLGIEYRANHANGGWRWLYTQSVIFNRTANGLPQQILGVSIDITERKQSEQALQQNEAWTRLAAQIAQLGAWRLHLDTNLVEMDERMRQIWDASDAAVMLPLAVAMERIHADDRDRVAQTISAALHASALGGYEIEHRIVCNDGTERWVLSKGQVRFEGEGAARRAADFFGTTLDITDRKQSEAVLAEQEQRYRYIFEAVNVAILEEDFSDAKAAIDRLKAAGVQDFRQYFTEHPEVVQQMVGLVRMQDVNPAAVQMFGAQEKAELLSSLAQIFVPETQAIFLEELVAIANGETALTAETVLQTLRGDRLDVLFTITFPPAFEPYDRVLVSLLDITQRKQAETALQVSEERLSLALRSAQAGMWQWFKADNRSMWSDENFRLMGCDPGQVSPCYESWMQVVHPDDRERADRAVQQALDEDGSLYFEYRVCLPDGSVRWLADIGQITYDEQGNQEGMIGLQIDISKRKQSELERDRIEAELRQSEERLSLALKAANQGLYDLNVQTGETIVSPEYARMLGYEPDEFEETNAKWRDRLHPDDLGVVYQTYEDYVSGKLDTYRVEFRQRTQSGAWKWILSVGKILSWDSNGQPLRMLGIHTDITVAKQREAERQQAEEALRQSEERLRLALDAGCMGAWEWNLETNVQQWDVNQYKLFGMDKDQNQLSADAFFRFIHPDDLLPAQQLTEQVLEQGSSFHTEFRIILPDGSVRWLSSQGVVVRNSNHQPIRLIGVNFDITERKRDEEERERLLANEQAARQEAETANRIKDEFLAVLSHELRSPLNPILGWSRLLQTGKFDAEKTKRALETIERNAKQQTQLIDDLLDISKILRGKLILNEAPVDLALTIAAALETVRLAAEAKSIEIKTDLDSFLPPVLGDGGRLQQVVLNLLSNAIKFTPAGGQVEVRLKQVRSKAQIQVKDTGKGIAPDFLPHVFESFRQEDGKTTRKFGGLGLGLAIVRQLTELHGGTVRAESQGEGTGATFTVCFPLMRTPSSSFDDSLLTNASLSEASALQGIRVLVVDDEADMRDLVVAVLEQAGAIVQSAASAAEVLAILDQFQPMVLVSDIGMPGMDGYELMRQVKSRSSNASQPIPAIALTAYAMEQDQQQALAAGFQRHLAKPIEPEVLIEAIVTLAQR